MAKKKKGNTQGTQDTQATQAASTMQPAVATTGPPKIGDIIIEDILRRLTELVNPIQIFEGCEHIVEADPVSRATYGPIIHASIIRFKMLGLSDDAVAAAVSISGATLAKWKNSYPKLAYDLRQAIELSKAHVILLLRELMKKEDQTGLGAIKFFLESIAPEFKKKADLSISTLGMQTIGDIKRVIYGIEDNADEEPGPDHDIIDVAAIVNEPIATHQPHFPALPLPTEILEGSVPTEGAD